MKPRKNGKPRCSVRRTWVLFSHRRELDLFQAHAQRNRVHDLGELVTDTGVLFDRFDADPEELDDNKRAEPESIKNHELRIRPWVVILVKKNFLSLLEHGIPPVIACNIHIL